MSALLIIDVQNDFMKGGSLEVSDANEILQPINSLRDKLKFDLVVLSQDYHPSNHISFASNHTGEKLFSTITLENGTEQVMWPDHCVQESHGCEFHKDLKILSSDEIVRKGMEVNVDSYSAFMGNDKKTKTRMETLLKEKNIKSVYVCGVAADYCVFFTAMDSKNAGFDTYFMKDLTKAVNPKELESIYQQLSDIHVKVINSCDISL
ncbi:nicotinamidase [Tieghemostelium lacteum]|uniref:nicotinamidase n=1 Tax=Tieghemostelium lacteum TaxID=361077 RepID=A0A152A163_TIELA|nr:nicotinamidase [Tieghemostelium lacteum]|eukprot:KYR00003.1 nicotinamidase [Tieghemostelium lacteum]